LSRRLLSDHVSHPKTSDALHTTPGKNKQSSSIQNTVSKSGPLGEAATKWEMCGVSFIGAPYGRLPAAQKRHTTLTPEEISSPSTREKKVA